MLAFETVQTEASVIADAIETGTAILAWERGAVVGVHGAIASFVAFVADALIRAGDVLTCRTIATWRRQGTLVDVLVAQAAGVAERTIA